MERLEAITPATPLFGIGSILKRASAVFLQNPLLFIGLTAISAPSEFVGTTAIPQSLTAQIVFVVLTLTLSFILQAAVAYGTFQVMLRRNAPFGECLSRGVARFIPLFLVSLLVIAAVAALTTVLLVPTRLLVPGVLITVFLLAAVPLAFGTCWLSTCWMVIIPACVVERLGPVESLKRSAALTKGYRWPVLALFLLSMAVTISLSFGLGSLPATSGFDQASLFIISLVACIPQAFQSVMIAIIYHDLRVAKEGTPTERLAAIFE